MPNESRWRRCASFASTRLRRGDAIQVIAAQMAASRAGDYFAFLIYFSPSPAEERLIAHIQRRLRHVTKRAVTIGYGPRYLHSTGQYHKGGGDNGIFWQLTADPSARFGDPRYGIQLRGAFRRASRRRPARAAKS